MSRLGATPLRTKGEWSALPVAAGDVLAVVETSRGAVLDVQRVCGAPFSPGQVADVPQSEARSYAWALAEARRVGNAKAVAALGATDHAAVCAANELRSQSGMFKPRP